MDSARDSSSPSWLCSSCGLQATTRPNSPGVPVPVLVLSRLGCPSYDPGQGRYLAAHLPHARFIEHPDAYAPWFLGDADWILHRSEAFIRVDRPPVDRR